MHTALVCFVEMRRSEKTQHRKRNRVRYGDPTQIMLLTAPRGREERHGMLREEHVGGMANVRDVGGDHVRWGPHLSICDESESQGESCLGR